jgi:hypothetical protein
MCRFGNGTDNVSYNYKLLDLNGVDFYYYEFLNTVHVDATYGLSIHGCSPRIFQGYPKQNKALNTIQLSGMVGLPLSIHSYLSHVEFGLDSLEFIPKNIPNVNQTLRINTRLLLWTNILF